MGTWLVAMVVVLRAVTIMVARIAKMAGTGNRGEGVVMMMNAMVVMVEIKVKG